MFHYIKIYKCTSAISNHLQVRCFTFIHFAFSFAKLSTQHFEQSQFERNSNFLFLHSIIQTINLRPYIWLQKYCKKQYNKWRKTYIIFPRCPTSSSYTFIFVIFIIVFTTPEYLFNSIYLSNIVSCPPNCMNYEAYARYYWNKELLFR